jgi:ABC-type nitrate/sulfonate/bicarbonate transport system substrate-binding protein
MKQMLQRKGEVIKTKEKFINIDTKPLDSKKRINLGKKVLEAAGSPGANQFQVFIGTEGDILLRPLMAIPAREAWIYQNPAALRKLRQGLKEAGEGKLKEVKNLEKFLEEL